MQMVQRKRFFSHKVGSSIMRGTYNGKSNE
ncbi:hypothetical protein LINPERHAP1_LOCUS16896, partial [Linum perenne]